MSIVIQPPRPPARRPQMHLHPVRSPLARASAARPVIAAVDGSAAGRAATAEAIASARDLGAPVVLAHVRHGPSTVWGSPFYQLRLERALRKGRDVLAAAAAQAKAAGVEAQTEILEGPPARRIAEFARSRDAQLVVVGPRRPRAEPASFAASPRWASRYGGLPRRRGRRTLERRPPADRTVLPQRPAGTVGKKRTGIAWRCASRSGGSRGGPRRQLEPGQRMVARARGGRRCMSTPERPAATG